MANKGMCCCTGYGFWRLCPNKGKVILCVCPKKRVYFVLCPNHGPKMKGVVLNRAGISGYFRTVFCPKQGQGFKPSAAALHSNADQVPPPPPLPHGPNQASYGQTPFSN